MKEEPFHILEYDADKNAVIRHTHIFKPTDIAERCGICNFGDAIGKILKEFPHRLVTYFDAGVLIDKICIMSSSINWKLSDKVIYILRKSPCQKIYL